MPELERRALACREVASGADAAPWMEWVAAYHALLRCARAVREALGPGGSSARGAELADRDLDALAAELGAREHLDVDAALLRRLVSPSDGRTVGVVLEELRQRFGVDRAALELAIMPTRRRP